MINIHKYDAIAFYTRASEEISAMNRFILSNFDWKGNQGQGITIDDQCQGQPQPLFSNTWYELYNIKKKFEPNLRISPTIQKKMELVDLKNAIEVVVGGVTGKCIYTCLPLPLRQPHIYFSFILQEP